MLLLLQIPSQLYLLINVCNRVVNEVQVVLHNLQLCLCVSLKHSDLVIGRAVRLETVHAQLYSVALTKINVVFLVVRANIIVASGSSGTVLRSTEFGVRAHSHACGTLRAGSRSLIINDLLAVANKYVQVFLSDGHLVFFDKGVFSNLLKRC